MTRALQLRYHTSSRSRIRCWAWISIAAQKSRARTPTRYFLKQFVFIICLFTKKLFIILVISPAANAAAGAGAADSGCGGGGDHPMVVVPFTARCWSALFCDEANLSHCAKCCCSGTCFAAPSRPAADRRFSSGKHKRSDRGPKAHRAVPSSRRFPASNPWRRSR